MRVALVVAGVLVIVAGAVASEEQWPLRLELIWETPEKGEPVFPDGFPPPEIKAAFEERDIPDEDKEWVLNNIRVWGANKTKKLWLDDGSTTDIPVIKPGDKVRTFTVYKSRNLKYWLVRAMRIEGPEIPPKPEYPGSPTVEYGEARGAHEGALRQQKAHWREAFMDVDGRIYWEKEFGPYDTYLEDSWIGDVTAYVSDDGEVVVIRGGSRYLLFCDKQGTRTPAEDTAGLWSKAKLSSDGSTLAILRERRSSGESDSRPLRQSCVGLYDRRGKELWRSEWVNGSAEFPVVLTVAQGGAAVVFSVLPHIPGTAPDRMASLLGPTGATVGTYSVPGEFSRGAAFLKDGSIVTVVYDHTVQAIETQSGNELWRYEMEEGWQGSLRGVSSVGDVAVVSGCSDARCTPSKGELLIFNIDGRLLYRGQRGKAQASLSPSGAFLLEKAGGLKFSQLAVEG